MHKYRIEIGKYEKDKFLYELELKKDKDTNFTPVIIPHDVIITGLVPALLSIIAALILKKYPITQEIRTDMRIALMKKEGCH